MSSLVPIFSIESGHVIAALVKMSEGTLPEILFIHQEYFPFQNEPTGTRLEESALKVLDIGIKALHSYIGEKKLSNIKDPAIILGSPWYHSETRVIRNENRTPIIVKETLINELVKQEMVSANGSTLIDRKIGAISLNGYQTAKPFGKKASLVEFSLFLSLIPSSFKQKVEDSIHANFGHNRIVWQALSMVLFSGLSNLLPEKKEYLILDIGAELAEISLIKNGALDQTVSFPFGTSSIIRNVSKGLNVTPQIAHSLLELYQNNKMEAGSIEKTKEMLVSAESTWKSLFTESLSSLSKGNVLPNELFLFTSVEFLEMSKTFIVSEEFIQSMLPGGHFEIIAGDSLDLHKLVTVPMHGRRASTFQLSTLFVSWLLSQREM